MTPVDEGWRHQTHLPNEPGIGPSSKRERQDGRGERSEFNGAGTQ